MSCFLSIIAGSFESKCKDMKRILCPTDFSPAANNAAEYAAKLAQKTNAELALIHVLSLPLVYDDVTTIGVLKLYEEKIKEEKNQLQTLCAALKEEFKINCSCEDDVYTIGGALENKTAGHQSTDLVVMGTNGADTLYQFYYGSTSYRTTKNLDCPVLIIPMDYAYKDISQVVFASGYRPGDELLLQQLKQFLADFSPQLCVLHVSEKDTLVSNEIYHTFCNLTEEFLGYNHHLEFKRIVNEDESQAIEKFMLGSDADLLSVCAEHHGFLYRLFHKNLIKKLTAIADFPILIFHK